MVEFMKSLLEMLLSASPILVVLIVFEHIAKIRKKKADERQLEQKKGIIRTNYILKTESILTIIFVVCTIFCAFCLIMAIKMQEDVFLLCVFGFFFLVSAVGTVNMFMWKLEVNGDEITWRSTFGKKRTFKFEDIIYCELKRSSVSVYVNEKSYLLLIVGLMIENLWMI